ncbi:Ger(x)C family spore germination protein [Metabacillus rhizolycopersici]|uniref:Ger(X)C family spore germination protein n=1 Tax=Metabacillus rhizolycopersici TaxID=2875709 RepID=A0ABS7UZ71_9BACI|nr:Ger(x)C family spore germination protein [Metabacillus rhizolycopersici]MBZ5753314.1 Ger(x)C family spore germination protein [Metabacillus rhizolycopersici]
MKWMDTFLLTCSLLLVLTGCWDKKEVEERSYVVAIGMDLPKGIDINEEQAVDVTFQFSNPKLNIKGASPSGESERRDILTLTAPDLVTARNMANSVVTREVSFSHNNVLIISEELAKTESFYRILSTTAKDREVRRETNLIITEGKASEFIMKNKPEMMIRPHRYYRFLIDRATETGLVPESTINRFFAITDADADLFLAMYGSVNENQNESGFQDEDQYIAGQVPIKGENLVQLIGSAIFKEGKMIGKFTGEETRIIRMLDNTSITRDMFSSFPDPLNKKYKIGVRLKKSNKTEVKIKLRKGAPPKIDVKYPVEIKLLSVPSLINYSNNFENQKKLKTALESKMKENAEKLIEKTQKEFKSDPFYWSLYARPLFSSVKEYEEWDWTNKNYPFADIDVTMDIEITGFGKQLKESDIKKVID